VPGWLLSAVGNSGAHPTRHTSLHLVLKLRVLVENGILSAVCQRWPNPIQATVDANGRLTVCCGCHFSYVAALRARLSYVCMGDSQHWSSEAGVFAD